jgi:hypothetical protein
MPAFKIAHIRKEGNDIIIVPLDPDFGHKTTSDQQAIVGDLQRHAIGAGLRGRVVPVWGSSHSLNFIAPHNWHAFFKSISWGYIWANVNRELSW